jgi:hypothetical protein
MVTPVQEEEKFSLPVIPPDQHSCPLPEQLHHREQLHQRSADEDGTLLGEVHDEADLNRPRVNTSYVPGRDHLHPNGHSPLSPSQHRERTSRLDDDLMVLQAERKVSKIELEQEPSNDSRRSIHRTRSRTAQEPVDDFDISTNPIHEMTKVYQPPARPATKLARFFKKIHESSFLVRYFLYITPVMLILLVPTLLGYFVFKRATVGDVELFWFGVWLEIVWLTLWLGRVSLSSGISGFY